MSKSILLHIGTHNTGSTSIRQFLARASAQLRRDGVLYPPAGRPREGGLERCVLDALGLHADDYRAFRAPAANVSLSDDTLAVVRWLNRLAGDGRIVTDLVHSLKRQVIRKTLAGRCLLEVGRRIDRDVLVGTDEERDVLRMLEARPRFPLSEEVGGLR